MAEDKIDKTVIKRTQDILGKYVKKPPLTEKLLKKPPFRFLYDIFNVIIRDTGCFQGLYAAEEENIENIKDREDKMKYLQKMIDVIKITTKQTISVRTSKIVAGQEPEKTNELLQLMGEIIEKELDWRTAVENVLNKSISPTKPHRTLDKSKEKDTKSREKSKELRKNSKTPTTKTISPSTRENQKTKSKTTITMEKPKAEVRLKKEKSKKELKDTATKKTKSIVEKTKTDSSKTVVMDKTPSPKSIPTELIKETAINSVNEVVDYNENPKKIIQNPVTPPKEVAPSTQPTAEDNIVPIKTPVPHVASNDPSEDPKSMTITEKHASLKDVITESPQRSESRKSSAKRKTSGKNHRNASKARTEDSDSNQTSLNNIESLNTLNEEHPQQSASSQYAPIKELELNKPKTDSIKKLDNVAHNVKRETTFTRENSKDISGSFNENNNTTNRPRTSLRPPSARPASARPGAPRRRDRNIEIILQPNDQIKMSGINVKLETFGDFGDDGENLVIIESGNIDESLGNGLTGQAVAMDNAEGALEQQGHLVQQILETQKELVQQNNDIVEKQEKDTERSSTISTRQSSARQMNNLRDVIQNLTKSVNPFGKLMDFIPEDIDAMQLELSMWRDSYTQTAHELKKEKSLTESVTEPMKNQLTQIEANIKEYQEIIDASRTKILQNSEKILKMLTE